MLVWEDAFVFHAGLPSPDSIASQPAAEDFEVGFIVPEKFSTDKTPTFLHGFIVSVMDCLPNFEPAAPARNAVVPQAGVAHLAQRFHFRPARATASGDTWQALAA